MYRYIIAVFINLMLLGCTSATIKPPDAKETILNACQTLDILDGYRFDLEATIGWDMKGMAISFTVKPRGIIKNPDFCYFKSNLPMMEMSASQETVEVYRQGDKVVTSIGKKGKQRKWESELEDSSLSKKGAVAEIFTPFYKVAKVDRFLRDARFTETEMVNNIECQKIESPVPEENLEDVFNLKKMVADDTDFPGIFGTNESLKTTKAIYRFWVGKYDNELYKAQRTIEYEVKRKQEEPQEEKFPENMTVKLDITMTLSDHHQNVNIEIPEEVKKLLE